MMKNQEDAIFCSGNAKTPEENVAKSIDGKAESVDINGLVSPHAYSIIQLVKVHIKDSDEEIKIIQLRNPWGNEKEWNKDWSDKDSKSWDSIRPDEKAKYFVDAFDGKFWMAWVDFLAEFESLSICMIPNAESSNYHRVIVD